MATTGRASVPGAAGDPSRISGRATVPAAPAAPAAPAGRPPPPGRGRTPGGGPAPALVGKRRGRRWRKVLLVTGIVLVLVVGLGAGGLYGYTRSLESNMARADVFTAIPEEDRPAKPVARSTNILMLGSDSRDPEQVGLADTVMLLHIPSSQDEAYLISLPRDLWVYIPPNPDPGGFPAGQQAKLNASASWGGIPLTVMTVESYTGVRVDSAMLIDFGGFVEVTDAVGGVELEIEQTITSIHRPFRTFEEGTQQLTGEEALDYIRQRKQFAEGDFTRMRNQQAFLKALLDKAASNETLTNPGKLNAFLQTATSTLTVDEDLSLTELGWKFRHLRSDNLTFLTSPHAGTGSAGGQSVVFSDDEAAAEFYAAVRADRLAQWIDDNPDRVS